MYGEGATYDSIEGRFRIIKKEASQLQAEIDSGLRPEAPFRGNGSCPANGNGAARKPRTPKKDNNSNTGSQNGGVFNGRVTKSANSSPTKKRTAAQIKKELLEGSTASSLSCGDVGGIGDEHMLNGVESFGYHSQNAALDFDLPMDGVASAEHLSMMMQGTGYWDPADENGI